MAAALASAQVDIEVALVQLVLCTLITLWMVRFIEIRDACTTATSQAMSQPTPARLEGPQDEPMDVDPTPLSLPTASSLLAPQEPLPFPGKLVNGVRQVKYYRLCVPILNLSLPHVADATSCLAPSTTHTYSDSRPPVIPPPGTCSRGTSSRSSARDSCSRSGARRRSLWTACASLAKTNGRGIGESLSSASPLLSPRDNVGVCVFAAVGSPSHHSLLPGARKSHRGPRDRSVAKGPKKKGAVKLSTQRRELLFSGTTDGSNAKIRTCLPTERSKDTRTNAEKAELLAWVRLRLTFPSSHSNPSHLPDRPVDAPRKTGSSV